MRRKKEEIMDSVKFIEDIDETDFKEEMEISFYSYAKDVIQDRALPDIRDGLKPVHRRILYAMKDLGINYNALYKKSARIVGEVIGKYHPHGDSSVYDAAVRLSQSFKNSMPLIDGHGNFGSVDGDGAAAMRYCVTGNTLIPTDKGLLRIDEIVEDTELNSEMDITRTIKSYGGIRNKAEKFFNSGKHPIIQVVLENGLEIKGSYNHPILISNNIISYDWKTLDKLKIGQYAIVDVNTNNNMYGKEIISSNDLLDIIQNQINNHAYTGELNQKLRESDKETFSRFKKLFFQNIEKIDDDFALDYFYRSNNELLIKELQVLFLNNGIYSSLQKEDNSYVLSFHLNGTIQSQREYVLHKDLRNVMFVKIKEIHLLPDETVYSLRVKSDCHSFVGNGFINHNTEMRLARLSEYLLKDLDKNIVDFQDNYDGEESEPVILPALFPNLLLNGSMGIAVGMATNIPTHNISDIKNTLFYYLDNPKCNDEDLIERIKGPDFPTGGTIINTEEFKEFYQTGKATLTIKSLIEIEPSEYGRTNLIVKDIPFTYSGKRKTLINAIIDKVVNKKLDELYDVRDESNKDGMRIVLEVKRGIDIDNFIKKLYTLTDLRMNETYNFLVIHNNCPIQTNLRQYLDIFVNYQFELIERKSKFLLNRANNRIHIVNGLIKAVDLMDLIVDVIRSSKNEEQAKNILMGKTETITLKFKEHKKQLKLLDFSDAQAESILEYKLRRLTNLELTKLIDEKAKLEKEITRLTKLIKSKSLKIKEIKSNMEDIEKLFGLKRRTTLTNESIEKYIENEIIEDIYVTLDKFYYFKLIDKTSFDRSNENKENYRMCLETTNDDVLLLFSKNGYCNQLKLKVFQTMKIKDKGNPLENLTNFNKKDEVIFNTLINNNQDKDLIFLTKKGFIKKVKLEDFISKKTIIASTKFKDDDEIIFIDYVNDNNEIIITTEKDFVTRYKIDEIPLLKKTSVGVVGIKFKEPDDNISNIQLVKEKEKSVSHKNKVVLLKNITLKKRASALEKIK